LGRPLDEVEDEDEDEDEDGEGGTQDDACVLSSSLQCGDQWRDVTDVSRETVCKGAGLPLFAGSHETME
jgi:hypothetical protein